jgi:endonuclease/exonuclease/phosphatase family metal-dependent hydrolase
MRYIVFILFGILATAYDGRAQEFTVMFYNTENLFDTVDDTLRDDNEFLPDGTRRWTPSRYWKKIDALSRVIVAAGGWEPPLLAGLCEVENKDVVMDLAERSILAKAGYNVVHRESPDTRGIDMALMYRRDMVKVTEVRSWVPVSGDGEIFDTRNLLYVRTLIYGDTLHIILCHFPSRRGGILAAEETRRAVSSLLRSKIDSLLAGTSGKISLMVMGDFNAAPSDRAIANILDGGGIVNLAAEHAQKGIGSYRFRGLWEMIDQILVSGEMTTGKGPFTARSESFSVFDAPFMLEDDPDYPGKRPTSTYRAYQWAGGYSDHLPVLVKVTHN